MPRALRVILLSFTMLYLKHFFTHQATQSFSCILFCQCLSRGLLAVLWPFLDSVLPMYTWLPNQSPILLVFIHFFVSPVLTTAMHDLWHAWTQIWPVSMPAPVWLHNSYIFYTIYSSSFLIFTELNNLLHTSTG